MNFEGALVGNLAGIGMAVDRSGSTVWLAGSGQILKIDVASGSVTTFPTNSWLHGTLALAPNGDVIFAVGATPGLASINRMDPSTGAINTVLAASPSPTFVLQPVALCVDASGNIYYQ